MATSYTSSLRLAQPTPGELDGTWGAVVNNEITALVEAAVAGYASIALSDANYTLSTANGAADEARQAVLNFTGVLTAGRDVVVPAVSKVYVVRNSTTGGFALTVKTSGGSGVAVPANTTRLLYCDGTNVLDGMPLKTVNNSSLLGAGNVVAGDVTGPAASSDGELVLFDSTTGKAVKRSNAITGVLKAASGVLSAATAGADYASAGSTTTYTVVQNFTASGITLKGSSTGTTTFQSLNASATNYTIQFPASTGVVLTTAAAVTVGQGGTGLQTLTANNLLVGNGTSNVAFIAPGASGNVLTSTGAAWQSSAPAGPSLSANNAFTGANSFQNATGQTFLASTTTGQDGIVVVGRAGGSGSFRVTLSPATLSANRSINLPDAAGTLLVSADPTFTGLIRRSASTSVTAGTNAQGQGALTSDFNVITTASSNPSGVTLPTAVAGMEITVINRGANPVNVYPATGGAIDALATNASVSLPVGGVIRFVGETGSWESSLGLTLSGAAALSSNNAFTGANTFYNATGQTFGTATSTQDGIIIKGAANGSSSYRVSLVPAALTASRTVTLPNEDCEVGFRNIPQITKVADGAVTMDLSVAGKHIYHTSTAGTVTIPANASVAYPIGTAITFVNGNGAGDLTIAITTDTLYLAGAGTTGSKKLSANGVATAIKIAATSWIISGTNLVNV